MRRYVRLTLFILVTLCVVPLQIIFRLIPIWGNRYFWLVPRLWHKAVARIFNVRITIEGEDFNKQAPDQPILYTSNHQSYLDIVVLGSLIKGCFISKSDVANWPVFGFLAKLQKTVFIKRERRALRIQSQQMTEVMDRGINMVLFPEGTTTDGMHVLPFKTSLFGVAQDHLNTIQPVSVIYTHINDEEYNHSNKDNVAWYINQETGYDPDMAPHLWDLLALRSIDVTVKFHNTIDVGGYEGRKELAQAAHEPIARSVLKKRLPHLQEKALNDVKR